MSQASAPAKGRARADRSDSPRVAPATRGARVADAALVLLFLSLTFLLGAFPLKDTDFWWHLKAGDMIRQSGQVPTVDTLTFAAEGRPWVDLHWVFQVLISLGFERFGVVGLSLAKCAITTLAVWLLISARRREWPVWAMLLAWLPALLVLSGRMYIRPETLTLLYLSLDLAILARWERRPWLAFGLPVVQVAWVNTQGLFLLGPIVVGFALIDAAVRRGAFEAGRRGWWRATLAASVLTGLACLANPYGFAGAIYPLQLAGTMSNPIFKRSIAELKPLATFFDEVGFDNLPLQLHALTMLLGLLSFLIPTAWSLAAWFADRRVAGAPVVKATRGKKAAKPARSLPWTPSPFRLLLYVSFSALSLAATRNSHQFAAVVGTVTAWNLGEWAAAIRQRRAAGNPSATLPERAGPRLLAFAAIVAAIACVGSGRLYAWAGEGRTIGLGEEPLWFPHRAVEFAGGPGMPERLAGFHNGHPSLFEYRWGPEKKVYQDARLEVMGPELYSDYVQLSREIARNEGDWAKKLDSMGRPSLLIDNIQAGSEELSATLLNSRHWRCVWNDPIANVFVHDSNATILAEHEVDFLARHFRREADTSADDPATLLATIRSLRTIGSQLRIRAGGEKRARSLLLLAADYARRLHAVDPSGLDGFKQAGLIEAYRDLILAEKPIPRFRLPFDPTFDLSSAREARDLRLALEIAPEDGFSLWSLARLYSSRGMDEAALPIVERFAALPYRNLSQKREKANANEQVAALRAHLGPDPKTDWGNLSDLDKVVADLLATGRAESAARVIESAYRPEARPWDWADRLALLRFHLGQPEKARAAWLAATGALAPVSVRTARVAATYLVEGDFDLARKTYREAIAADPNLFEAHYGLALIEQDTGHAPEALEAARLAEKAAPNDNARSAARLIGATAEPYARARP